MCVLRKPTGATRKRGGRTEVCVFRRNPWRLHGNSRNQMDVLPMLDVNPRKQHYVFYGNPREQYGNPRKKDGSNTMCVSRKSIVAIRKLQESTLSASSAWRKPTGATRCVCLPLENPACMVVVNPSFSKISYLSLLMQFDRLKSRELVHFLPN